MARVRIFPKRNEMISERNNNKTKPFVDSDDDTVDIHVTIFKNILSSTPRLFSTTYLDDEPMGNYASSRIWWWEEILGFSLGEKGIWYDKDQDKAYFIEVVGICGKNWREEYFKAMKEQKDHVFQGSEKEAFECLIFWCHWEGGSFAKQPPRYSLAMVLSSIKKEVLRLKKEYERHIVDLTD